MKVWELISALEKMPPNAKVRGAYDGAPRLEINSLWLARSGIVVLTERGQVIYDADDRPADSPNEPYWHAL